MRGPVGIGEHAFAYPGEVAVAPGDGAFGVGGGAEAAADDNRQVRHFLGPLPDALIRPELRLKTAVED